MPKQTVFATDTNILLQRSRFSYSDLSRPDGHPSGALYGTLKSIFALAKRFEPDYFIPVFDVGKSKFRTSISSSYKGNRGEKEHALISQFAATRGILELMGFPVYYERGVEADDLLAKLAIHHCKNKDLTILTQDHDICQLASNDVTIFRPKLGARGEQFITGMSFSTDIGIEASRAPEIWAITGDSGDNIPGIPRIGWKTAQKMVLNNGSLWHALANEKKLQPHYDQCITNYSLIKLDGTVASEEPVFKKLSQVREEMYDKEDVSEFFEQWGMNRFLIDYNNRVLL